MAVGPDGNDRITVKNCGPKGLTAFRPGSGIVGSSGDDIIRTSNRKVRVKALRVFGGPGRDRIRGFRAAAGDSGNDILFGTSGNDKLTGGLGNDVFPCREGAKDLALGGDGSDKAKECESLISVP